MLAGAIPTARATPRIVSASSPSSSENSRTAASRISVRSRSPWPQGFRTRCVVDSNSSGIRPSSPANAEKAPPDGGSRALGAVAFLSAVVVGVGVGVGDAFGRRQLGREALLPGLLAHRRTRELHGA